MKYKAKLSTESKLALGAAVGLTYVFDSEYIETGSAVVEGASKAWSDVDLAIYDPKGDIENQLVSAYTCTMDGSIVPNSTFKSYKVSGTSPAVNFIFIQDRQEYTNYRDASLVLATTKLTDKKDRIKLFEHFRGNTLDPEDFANLVRKNR